MSLILPIIVSPTFYNDDFKNKLKAKINDDETLFNILNAETMFSTFPQLRKPGQPVQVVVDTISNQDGLEYDVAVLVGFEREIKEMKETLEYDKSIIYRSVTRAKQLVAIVTEPMQGGWFTDIGQGTKFNDDKEKLEMERKKQVLLKG